METPSPESAELARLLNLGDPPTGADHAELFDFQLYPYASVYLGAEGMMGGEARDRIAGFWRALGESPPPEPDHLAVMLALWARLEELESQAEDSVIADRWRHVRAAFLFEHVLSWLPVYLDKLAEIAPPFYRRWGELVTEALRSAALELEVPEELSSHLREAPAVADPRGEGADAFLSSLLAPVRTGMILVRSDLERAARGLEIGSRKGERKYVLKALLGQDSTATLRWLAREAESWVGRHRNRVGLQGGAAEFWAARSLATSRLLDELTE